MTSRTLVRYVHTPEVMRDAKRGKRGRRTPRQLLRARPFRRLLSAVRARRAQTRLVARTWKRYGERQPGPLTTSLFKPRILRKARVPKQTLRRLAFLRKAAGFSVGRALRYAAPVALLGAGYGAVHGVRGLRAHVREPRAKRIARYRGALAGVGAGALSGYLIGGTLFRRRSVVQLGLMGALAGLHGVGGWRLGAGQHDREVAKAILTRMRRRKGGRR